ncbi:AAA family ATPase [Actinoplanes sp. NPDC051513]|uniref:helix-turn-helix transcriptional regulator n=1 Tax=Actinoplanes sp. NPDC051513 TaxID=3363908 RepID=UPI0037B48B60
MLNGHPVLRGRRHERDALDRLLRDIRAGQSRVLVLRGEAGAGKTALLDYLTGSAATGRVARAAGVEPETEIAYSALQQLIAPLFGHLGKLPEPQRVALSTAFGLSAGAPPEALMVGLAVLGLLAEAASDEPLVCVVDDVQWLDRMSEVILTFVARRLDAESVALVFAARSPGDEQILGGLPEMRVDGLAEADARALLDQVLPGPVDDRVRDRIVAETRGNPLALLELPRGLSPAELAFGFGGQATPVASRVEEGFQRRVAALPVSTRTLLLAAAVEPVGDVPLLWRAAQRLGVAQEASAAAEAAGLVELGARVRFRHPLVRSAVWRSASPEELRAVHAALAEVTDPSQDPDRRAWHRAHAAVGTDEEVAAELERSAGRALSRGGRSAAASFLQRAAELTPDAQQRAGRALAAARARFAAGAPADASSLLSAAELGPLDPLQQAGVERLRAQIAFALNPGRAAGPQLLAAARKLDGLDAAAARDTYLEALGAALLGGDDARAAAEGARSALSRPDAQATTGGARPDAPATTGGARPDAPTTTEGAGAPSGALPLLGALVAWTLDGHAAAAPRIRAALDGLDDLGQLWLAVPAALEVWDDGARQRLTERAVGSARATGALALLPPALVFRAGALLDAGRFADAAELLDELDALGAATGLPVDPSATLTLAALRGREEAALDLIEVAAKGAEGRLLGVALLAKATLCNGLGRYPAALDAARKAVDRGDLGVTGAALLEMAEAAAHGGEPGVAAEARDRLAERTSAAGTDGALGVQALADALAEAATATSGPTTGAQADHSAGGGSDAGFREAIDRLGGLPLARARLLYGEWLRRAGRRSDAREQLRAAHEAFAAMGAEAFAERAGRELAATGETVRKRVLGDRDELTPQESQIARLAVAGRTNAEIGAVLFLSPRTVEWHLRKVFTRLGISSRRELAAALRDQ